MMKKLNVVILCIVVFSVMPFFLFGENDDEGLDLAIRNVSVNISEGTSFCVTGDVLVKGTGEFINYGKMCFVNTEPADLTFSSTNSGDGKFVFSGSDCTLTNAVEWSRVAMAMDGGYLFLDGNLTVTDSLELDGGIIEAGSSKVVLENNLPNCLLFNNVEGSNSYIIGSFARSVVQNGSYYFPVGDETGFHPFLIQNADADDDIEITYDPEISGEWSLVIQDASFSIEDAGGWNVSSATNFYSGLSLFGSDGSRLSEEGDYSILYATDNASFSSNYQNLTSSSTNGFYLLGSDKLSAGIYTIANQEVARLANFVFASGNSSTQFQIPEISKYSNVELIVYNRWGQQVYVDHDYYNGFDCADYPQGTYFYELKLHQGESVELIRDFIEIKREK